MLSAAARRSFDEMKWGWRQARAQYIFFLITMSAEVGLCYKQSSVQSNTLPPVLCIIIMPSQTEKIKLSCRVFELLLRETQLRKKKKAHAQ